MSKISDNASDGNIYAHDQKKTQVDKYKTTKQGSIGATGSSTGGLADLKIDNVKN